MRPSYAPTHSLQATHAGGLRVEAVLAAYCGLSIILVLSSPSLKALYYAIPFIALIGMLATRRVTLPVNAPPYLILVAAGIVMAPFNSIRGLQDSWLMLMGLGAFCFGYNYRAVGWWVVFGASIVATIVPIAQGSGIGHGFVFDMATSSSTLESSTSFVFGVLAAWAAIEKRWSRVAFALLMAVLTLKRIVVLAGVITVVAVILPRWFIDRLLRPVPMLILNSLLLVLTFAYATGEFNHVITVYTGQSADQLGQGRQGLYFAPVSMILKEPLQFLFFGIGPGGVYNVLQHSSLNELGHQNLHNDSLKICLEYGGIVWVAFFTAMYWNKRVDVRLMMFYTNLILLTDNTLIYAFAIYPTALALQHICAKPADDGPPRKRDAALRRRSAMAVDPARQA